LDGGPATLWNPRDHPAHVFARASERAMSLTCQNGVVLLVREIVAPHRHAAKKRKIARVGARAIGLKEESHDEPLESANGLTARSSTEGVVDLQVDGFGDHLDVPIGEQEVGAGRMVAAEVVGLLLHVRF
jgi:hypothetical protein